MTNLKIVTVLGTRPEIIKLSSTIPLLAKKFEHILVHTEQHYSYNMDRVFFDELNVRAPDYCLGVGSGTHAIQTAKMLIDIERVLVNEKPSITLVLGDTNSTLAGALASTKLQIPVGHIEAGMRSFDMSMPEEINRLLTDHISTLLFAPTVVAVKNLEREGLIKGIYKVGDVTYDALLKNKKIATKKSKMLQKLALKKRDYLLATIHRPSNTDNPKNLKNIIQAFVDSGEKIIFPIHPRTKKFLKIHKLQEILKGNETVSLIEPLGYLDFLNLMFYARKILTDSGGVQREAYMLKVPCITLRENTEWTETVEDRWNILTGTDKRKIINAIQNFEPKGKQYDHYGKGDAAKNIIRVIEELEI